MEAVTNLSSSFISLQKSGCKIVKNYSVPQLKSVGNELENQKQSFSNLKKFAWSEQESVEDEIADIPTGDK